MITIKNMPDKHKKYVIAREMVTAKSDNPKDYDSDYYFWASFDTEEEAYPVAVNYVGQVFVREEKT